MGKNSPVLEILLLSKIAKFHFRPMDYSPWSSKNLIDRNWLKNSFDVKFMHTNFGERGLSPFRDIAFQNDSINIFDNFVLVLLGSYWYISWWFGAVVS